MKEELISEEFNRVVSGRDVEMMKTLVKKLVSNDDRARSEVPQLMEHFDQGNEVDLSGLDDMYTKQKLSKLC